MGPWEPPLLSAFSRPVLQRIYFQNAYSVGLDVVEWFKVSPWEKELWKWPHDQGPDTDDTQDTILSLPSNHTWT